MNIDAITTAIDDEITRLQKARGLLAALDAPAVKRRGRPKRTTEKSNAPKVRKPLSAEARARIAAAQKRRWAASRERAK